jgi:AraC-like DNA-binding protein
MFQVKQTYSPNVARAAASVKNIIDSDPLARKSTEDLAAEIGINRNLLQKAFKAIYKKRIKEYQFEKRMEAACEMLRNGRLIKKEISSKCGYDNPNNFSNAFKKMYNMSPSQWQRLNG